MIVLMSPIFHLKEIEAVKATIISKYKNNCNRQSTINSITPYREALSNHDYHAGIINVLVLLSKLS